MRSSPYVALVVVNHRTPELVATLLASTTKLTGNATLRIAVVDNSDDPGELAALRRACAEASPAAASVEVVAAPGNVGYAAGNNLGHDLLAETWGDPTVVVVANPDTRIRAGDLDEILALVTTPEPRVWVARTGGAVGTGLHRLHPATGRAVPMAATTGDPQRLVYPGGHFLLVPDALWRGAGGFSTDFFLYCEELDLLLRLWEADPRTRSAVTDTVAIAHRGGASTTETDGAKSVLTHREATRSRVVLYRRHRRLRPWLAPLATTRLGLAAALLARGRPTEARAVVNGLWAGWRHRSAPVRR